MELQVHPAKQSENGQINNAETKKPVSGFRRYLPQVLAAAAKNLLLYELGTIIGFQVIFIAQVLNAKAGFSFNADQASWFASLLFIGQLLGTLLTGVMFEPIGRKKTLVLLNLPVLLGWLAISSEYSVSLIYAASIIIGFALGSAEAPAITYIGEISEPKLRSILTSFSELSVNFGMLTVFLLGMSVRWQVIAYICAVVPVAAAAIISQIPESPIWLLAKERTEEAEKSLCWLRGWVKPEYVRTEFSQLVSYKNQSFSSEANCPKVNQAFENKVELEDEKKIERRENMTKGEYDTDTSSDDSYDLYKHKFYSIDLGHRKSVTTDTVMSKSGSEQKKPNTKFNISTQNDVLPKESGDVNDNENKIVKCMKRLKNYVWDLSRPAVLRPLLLMSGFFFFYSASGYGAIRPFAIPIFKELGFAVDPFKVAVVTVLVLSAGKITLMFLVNFVGKRRLVLVSTLSCGGTCIALGVYALLKDTATSWVPVVLYLAHVYSYGLGLCPVPWMYLSEVFPFRGRATAAGLSAGTSYIFAFLVTKTFMTIKTWITLPGSLFIYGTISLLGSVYIYFLLPETEGETLQDIEDKHFNKNKS